jgi:hypothetical protein
MRYRKPRISRISPDSRSMGPSLAEISNWHIVYRQSLKLSQACPENLIYQYLAAKALVKEITLSLSYFWEVRL